MLSFYQEKLLGKILDTISSLNIFTALCLNLGPGPRALLLPDRGPPPVAAELPRPHQGRRQRLGHRRVGRRQEEVPINQ